MNFRWNYFVFLLRKKYKEVAQIYNNMKKLSEDKAPLIPITKGIKYEKNPFLDDQNVITINRGKKQIITGKTNKVLMDTETGQMEGVAILHKFQEVDKDQFVKLFVNEIQSLFGLSKTGIKTFGFLLNCLKINDDRVYMSYKDLMEYCDFKQLKSVYNGLSELVANKIIAMSTDPYLFFINPNLVFNGNRIAFVKEYRLKQKVEPKQIQTNLEFDNQNNNTDELQTSE